MSVIVGISFRTGTDPTFVVSFMNIDAFQKMDFPFNTISVSFMQYSETDLLV